MADTNAGAGLDLLPDYHVNLIRWNNAGEKNCTQYSDLSSNRTVTWPVHLRPFRWPRPHPIAKHDWMIPKFHFAPKPRRLVGL